MTCRVLAGIDHLMVQLGCAVTLPWSFGVEPAQGAAAFADYQRDKSGPLAGNILQRGAFAAASTGETWPSLQLFLLAVMPRLYPEADPDPRHGMTLVSTINRARSRGEITLASPDPLAPPVINLRYLSEPHDPATATAGVRCNLQILHERAFDAVRGSGTFPNILPTTKAEIEANGGADASTIWHVSGTGKMATGEAGVVNRQLRLHGLSGPRVVDAPVIPQGVSANTNAAVMLRRAGISHDLAAHATAKCFMCCLTLAHLDSNRHRPLCYCVRHRLF